MSHTQRPDTPPAGDRVSAARAKLLEALDLLDQAVAAGAVIDGLVVLWASRTADPPEERIQWVHTVGSRDDIAQVMSTAAAAIAQAE